MTTITRTLGNGSSLEIALTTSRTDDGTEYAVAVYSIDGIKVGDTPYFLVIGRDRLPAGLPEHIAALVKLDDGRTLGLSAAEADAIDAYFAPFRAKAQEIRKARFAAHKANQAKARAYDNLHNEGGEGYNPYR